MTDVITVLCSIKCPYCGNECEVVTQEQGLLEGGYCPVCNAEWGLNIEWIGNPEEWGNEDE